MLAPHADPPLESQTLTHVAGLWRGALSGAACAPEHEAKHPRRMALMSPSLDVPSGGSFSTLSVGSPHTCHPPDISATQISAMVPAGRQRLGD